MDTINPAAKNSADAHRPETEAERQRRLAWEVARIAEARASAAAGRVVSSEEVDAWIDSLDTDHELPPPRSGR
jgi:predicted transcriptional regulator